MIYEFILKRFFIFWLKISYNFLGDLVGNARKKSYRKKKIKKKHKKLVKSGLKNGFYDVMVEDLMTKI